MQESLLIMAILGYRFAQQLHPCSVLNSDLFMEYRDHPVFLARCHHGLGMSCSRLWCPEPLGDVAWHGDGTTANITSSVSLFKKTQSRPTAYPAAPYFFHFSGKTAAFCCHNNYSELRNLSCSPLNADTSVLDFLAQPCTKTSFIDHVRRSVPRPRW